MFRVIISESSMCSRPKEQFAEWTSLKPLQIWRDKQSGASGNWRPSRPLRCVDIRPMWQFLHGRVHCNKNLEFCSYDAFNVRPLQRFAVNSHTDECLKGSAFRKMFFPILMSDDTSILMGHLELHCKPSASPFGVFSHEPKNFKQTQIGDIWVHSTLLVWARDAKQILKHADISSFPLNVGAIYNRIQNCNFLLSALSSWNRVGEAKHFWSCVRIRGARSMIEGRMLQKMNKLCHRGISMLWPSVSPLIDLIHSVQASPRTIENE